MLPPASDISAPEKQTIYRAKFTAQTGLKPVGDVTTAMRVKNQNFFLSGLEAQVKQRGADGKDFLRTVFTPIQEHHRERNKYHAATEDRKHGPQDATVLPQEAAEQHEDTE